MKQSSIEFAVTSLEKLIPSGNDLVVGAILLQAKAMHKEEIINAWEAGYDEIDIAIASPIKYYHETFNTK